MAAEETEPAAAPAAEPAAAASEQKDKAGKAGGKGKGKGSGKGAGKGSGKGAGKGSGKGAGKGKHFGKDSGKGFGKGKDGMPKRGPPLPGAPDAKRMAGARPEPSEDAGIKKLCKENWEGGVSKPFEEAVVEKLYKDFLGKKIGGGREMRDKLGQLELSGYLEHYLWPHFVTESSWTHVMSIVAMINLKFNEGLSAWPAFAADPSRFGALFARVIELPAERAAAEGSPAMSDDEHTRWVLFFVRAFASLEDEMVRAQVLRLVSLPMWATLSPRDLAAQLAAQPHLSRPWKKLEKRRAKEAKEGAPPASSRHEREFVPGLLKLFLATLRRAEELSPGEPAERSVARLLERSLELFTDLMAQLPTRRFFHAVLLDSHVLLHASLSPFGKREAGKLTMQLLGLLDYYERFEVDDHRGVPLSDADVKSARCEQLQALQRKAFSMESLQDFALSNLAAVDTPNALTSHFSRLQPTQLAEIASSLGIVHSNEQGEGLGKSFLVHMLVRRYQRREAQHEAIGSLPLYPDEIVPWDAAQLPDLDHTGDSCLALPKLNLQFLTLNDYLLRNFNLFRLEATYDIKQDIEDAVTRMQPRQLMSGATQFRGWARMALPLADFRLFKVGKPFLGEARPSEVRAEASISLKGCRFDAMKEWSEIRRHDVVFLLSITAAIPEGGKVDGSTPFPQRVGLVSLRGAEVVQVVDEEGHVFTGESEQDQKLRGDLRKLELRLDTAQYHRDAQSLAEGRSTDVYQTFNLLMRRKQKENNFKAILDSIRELMTTPLAVPEWLQDVLLGYGDPAAAAYWSRPAEEQVSEYDFYDTFLDLAHVQAAFPHAAVQLATPLKVGEEPPKPPFRLTIPASVPRAVSTDDSAPDGAAAVGAAPVAEGAVVTVAPYTAEAAGPYPEDAPRMNPIRFTPMQVEALRAAMNPGLTVVVGPPGTGKTDTAVQMISNIHHTFPQQRTLIITHSNQALNDVFEKLLLRDIDERYMLRLGHGEELLETEKDFSRQGRVNHMLKRRLDLLVKVEALATSLDVPADVGYTCETSQYFYLSTILTRWEVFEAKVAPLVAAGDTDAVADHFPFADFFADAPPPLFRRRDASEDRAVAAGCFVHIKNIFKELDECRAFELLRSSYDRGNFLLSKHAKVIAMTCTHAAIKRRDLVALGFQYDNLVMEEAAQIMEIETFIPMVLQNPDPATGRSRLKRVVLIGDHHQLPPVVKNLAFQKYSRLDQSLFARFVRLGAPVVQLDRQGRARKSMADLYRWRYTRLGDLKSVAVDKRFQLAVPGFAHAFQLIDVVDPNGVGESVPLPHYIQNLAEAEYVVATYMYMRLQGIPASKISIITTYNGQKDLITDVALQRCGDSYLYGMPAKIATTDKFQGQQNDYILLSLVRTKSVGHVRDVRRLVVSVSRARLGLYVFCCKGLFENCVELRPTFAQLLKMPPTLQLVPTERAPTQRRVDEPAAEGVLAVEGLQQMGELVASMAEYAERERAQMYDDYAGGDDAEMPEAPPEQDEEAEAPPDDDEQ